MSNPLDISDEISRQLNRNAPVVALESSVIAQGLPRPTNVEAALAMEEQVREAGAVPATIGVIEGKIRVGLSKDEIEKLAAGKAEKLASRDLPYAVFRNLDGGTTVSATARIAAAAGICVMATGGIGGVHRGHTETNDISADLWELLRTRVLVVCSGVKAVLDVPATAEWLETHSVPVYGYGTDELPCFYYCSSGVKVPKVDSVSDVAELVRLSVGKMGMACGIVVAVPIPKRDEINARDAIEKAAAEAAHKGISGKELTPWLLNRVGDLTGGKSLKANVALLKNNAHTAAEIAVEVAQQEHGRMGFTL